MPLKPDANIDPFLDAIEKITEFELQSGVTNWRYRDFEVWPIVKYVLVKQMIFAMNRGYTPSDRYKRYPKFAKRFRRAQGISALFQKKPDVSVSNHTLPTELLRSYQYWCLGSGSGFYDLNGIKVSQHHHALRVALMEKGHQSLGLYSGFDPEKLPIEAEYGPQASLDHFIKSVGKTAQVPSLSRAYLRKHFKELDAVIATTGHGEIELFAFVDTIIGRTDYTIACFSEIFRAARPTAIFTSNYASFYGWALAHTCRRHGIDLVDIQHGIEGRFNGSYYFSRTPEDDWAILPTSHLCWSKSDAELFLRQHSERKAAVVGPTWHQFVKFLPKQVESTKRDLSAFRSDNRPLVLFAAQQAEDVLVAKRLHQAGLIVLFRSHPLRREETEKLAEPDELVALGYTLASETPLPKLLDTVDGVLTGYSAVVLEACLKGVPVLATGSYASLLESDYKRELNGLLTVRPAANEDEKISVALEWASQIDCEKPREESATASFADALHELGIPL